MTAKIWTCVLLSLLATAIIVQATISNSQCGRRKTARIMGGDRTLVNEFPMMAGLFKQNYLGIYCGAVIVSDRYAVTAAHCIRKLKPEKVALLVGQHDQHNEKSSPYGKMYLLEEFKTHPDYQGGYYYDIALVRTKKTIEFNVAVGPVCLPEGNDQYVGKTVEAVGWGTNKIGGKFLDILRKVSLKVITNTECQKTFSKDLIDSKHICTDAKSKNVCEQDDGGPLLLTTNGRLYLVGIVAYGSPCVGDQATSSTRVTSFVDWIKENMK